MFRRSPSEVRVLVLALIGRDAPLLAQSVGSLGLDAKIVADVDELLQELQQGVGAAIVADEAIRPEDIQKLTTWLSKQPSWSDPPFIILTARRQMMPYSQHRVQQLSLLGNFTLIERPMRPETLQSAVRVALRGRMKQYEIRSRQEDLLQANADLEQFAHSASHDLKEPLRNIHIFCELLEREYANGLDQPGADYLGLIKSSAVRMDRLLVDLLAYTQASSISDAPADVTSAQKALDAAMGNLAGAIQETGAQIVTEEMPAVRMRESHLQQLFQNLLGNALKYRHAAAAPLVSVTSERQGDEWLIRVRDNGIGIASEYQEEIFGIFQRLHTNSQYAGTGMGLAICKRIVERYRGRIWVESEPGQGSEFFFTVPG